MKANLEERILNATADTLITIAKSIKKVSGERGIILQDMFEDKCDELGIDSEAAFYEGKIVESESFTDSGDGEMA